jgi:hypothetical protein
VPGFINWTLFVFVKTWKQILIIANENQPNVFVSMVTICDSQQYSVRRGWYCVCVLGVGDFGWSWFSVCFVVLSYVRLSATTFKLETFLTFLFSCISLRMGGKK